MSEPWYFAYGSNLSPEQMKDRLDFVPESRVARLEGYRIAFNKRSTDGTGKANIVPHPAGVVWGVIYRCSPADLDILDGREGVLGGHYHRRPVRVRLDPGDEVEAIAYVAGDSKVDDSLVPDPEYVQKILAGARRHGLPEAYIHKIQNAANREEGPDQSSRQPG